MESFLKIAKWAFLLVEVEFTFSFDQFAVMLNLWYLWEIPIAKRDVSCDSITKRVISLSSKKKLCDTNRLFRPPLRYSDSLTHFIPVKSISHSFASTCTCHFSEFCARRVATKFTYFYVYITFFEILYP